ncbi:hypothetical protein NQD34_018503 [Periophthalmus magnuspinnatus]|nr:hypothetical protein NQD34_018503 [Periophthalmus magnuspinnatus]
MKTLLSFQVRSGPFQNPFPEVSVWRSGAGQDHVCPRVNFQSLCNIKHRLLGHNTLLIQICFLDSLCRLMWLFIIREPREPEEQRATGAESQRRREPEEERARGGESQRSREPEEQRARGAESQRSREPEEQRARGAESQREQRKPGSREPEEQRARGAESQRRKEPEEERARGGESQRRREPKEPEKWSS